MKLTRYDGKNIFHRIFAPSEYVLQTRSTRGAFSHLACSSRIKMSSSSSGRDSDDDEVAGRRAAKNSEANVSPSFIAAAPSRACSVGSATRLTTVPEEGCD